MFATPRRHLQVAVLFCLTAAILTGCTTTVTPANPERENPPTLNALLDAVDVRIAKLQRALTATAQSAVINGPDSPSTRTLAASQFSGIPATVYFLDDTGVVIERVATGHLEPIPWDAVPYDSQSDTMFSPAQLLPDGTPVMDARFERDGITVVARVRTQPFLRSAVDDVLAGTNIDSWIMETNTLQIYEPDPEEVGKVLLTDPMYNDFSRLLSLAQTMADEPRGAGNYDFLDTGFQSIVEKRATWDTITLPGVTWRVVMVQLEIKGEDILFPDDADVIFEARSLKAAAYAPAAKKAFVAGNETAVRTFFKDFDAKHDGIYNLAHISPEGVILYGEPRETSFDNYDLTEGRRDNDIVLLEAARANNDTWLVFDLAEGEKGLFYIVPVWDEDYLGAVYAIWLLPEDAI